jgi:hypothetical protein
MKVDFNVDVRFERVNRDANGNPGKVHVTVNGAPLCEMWSRRAFQQHKSGVSRVMIDEFMKTPCGQTADGTPGTQGCLPRLNA